jgi:hypothetical protein
MREFMADKFRPNVQRTTQILPEELWRAVRGMLVIAQPCPQVSIYSAMLVGSFMTANALAISQSHFFSLKM